MMGPGLVMSMAAHHPGERSRCRLGVQREQDLFDHRHWTGGWERLLELVPSRGMGSGCNWVEHYESSHPFSPSCMSWNEGHLTSSLTDVCHGCLESSHPSEYLWYVGVACVKITRYCSRHWRPFCPVCHTQHLLPPMRGQGR